MMSRAKIQCGQLFSVTDFKAHLQYAFYLEITGCHIFVNSYVFSTEHPIHIWVADLSICFSVLFLKEPQQEKKKSSCYKYYIPLLQ